MKELNWITIFTRIKYFQAILMFKCMNGLAPDYLTSKFTVCSDLYSHSLRSTTFGHLHIPRSKSKYFKMTFQYSGLIIWNNLPNGIKDLRHTESVKMKCAYLLSQNKTRRPTFFSRHSCHVRSTVCFHACVYIFVTVYIYICNCVHIYL